jgi:hypothetical protein
MRHNIKPFKFGFVRCAFQLLTIQLGDIGQIVAGGLFDRFGKVTMGE